jgi:isoleucyl-tRNA synthetase
MFAEHGSNCWFSMDAKDLLPEGYVCPKCGKTHFVKEQNTLDGWFDSGSTHVSVLDDKADPAWPEHHWPADLYLEGADQYRGWFQASLLTAIGAKGGTTAPFKAVLTHGWVVDGEGRAMHKSLGNGVDPQDMVAKYGADLVRLWVASADYQVDVRCSDNIFKQLSEAYRKIRNTSRIILANLNGFDPDHDMVAPEDMQEIDRWLLSRANELVRRCMNGYENYCFHSIYHDLTNFCTTDLSKLYVDITKDRVYTERADAPARRSAQSAMYLVLSAMVRLMAPLLSFTAEEIWQAMPHLSTDNRASVFFNDMPACDDAWAFPELAEHWNALFDLRDDVMKALELARADKKIGKSLDAKLTICTESDDQLALLSSFGDDLKTVFIVSGVQLEKGSAPEGALTETASGIAVLVEGADGCKCDRCWAYATEGKQDEDGFLCARCQNILEG